MDAEELLDEVLTCSTLLGAVGLRSQWSFYALTLAEWTLDYPTYDPTCLSWNDASEFRDGLLRVDEHNADAFIAAVEPYRVPLAILRGWIEREGVPNVCLLMLVDFDRKLFVHGYYEMVEQRHYYIPEGWRGVEGDPLDYAPEEVRSLWR